MFKYGNPRISKSIIKAGESVILTVPVTNAGIYDGEEVIRVYLKKSDFEGPKLTLRAFERILIPKGETVDVKIDLTGESFEWWDENAQRLITQPGSFQILVGRSSDMNDLQAITIELK